MRQIDVVLLAALGMCAGCHSSDEELLLRVPEEGGTVLRYTLHDAAGAAVSAEDASFGATIAAMRERLDVAGVRRVGVGTGADDDAAVAWLQPDGEGTEDAVKRLFAAAGAITWRIVDRDDPARGVDVVAERGRLSAWLARPEHAGRGPDEIDVSTLDLRSADVVHRWMAYADPVLAATRSGEGPSPDQPLTADEYFLAAIEADAERTFTTSDLESVTVRDDADRGSMIQVALNPSRAGAFGAFTEANVGQLMAMILDGRVAEEPATIQDSLEHGFVIRSGRIEGFTVGEMHNYMTLLRSEPLPLRPRLVSTTHY